MKQSDIEILKILEQDARLTPAQIATMLDMPEDEVKQAIKQLEKNKIIRRFKTVINWEKAGEEGVLALIEVRVSPQRDVGFDSVAERIYKFPEARTVYLISGGTHDLLVQVSGRTIQDVSNFVASKLSPIEGVQGTVTRFLLRRYKEDGDILADIEVVKRLPVTP